VSVFPIERLNCELVSDALQSRCRAFADAPDSQIVASLMLLIAPPVAVQITSPTSNLYCFAEAPTVQSSDVSALPLEL
jgi:hypothetical protein